MQICSSGTRRSLPSGHGTSAHAHVNSDAVCQTVESVWIPRSEVERVEPARRDGVEIKVDALAALKDGAQARKDLGGLVDQYREWLAKQDIPAEPKRREVAEWADRPGGVSRWPDMLRPVLAALEDPRFWRRSGWPIGVMAVSVRHA